MKTFTQKKMIAIRHAAIIANAIFYRFFAKEMIMDAFGVKELTVMCDIKTLNSTGFGLVYNRSEQCWTLTVSEEELEPYTRWAFNVLAAIQQHDFDKALSVIKHLRSIGTLMSRAQSQS